MSASRFFDNFFILALLFLMPIDYFYPLASIFREAGSKPFNLFVLFVLFFYFVAGRSFSFKKNEININLYLLTILSLGIIAFFVNSLVNPVLANNRTPQLQFFQQCLMFILFILVFNGLRFFFSRNELRQYILSVIPIVVLLHLIIFSLELCNIFNIDNPAFLLFFRNDAGLLDRASGLMSEPSYFGTFSGLFVIPLLFFCKKHKVLNILLALLLVFFSLLINAKTFFIVILPQILFLIFESKNPLKTKIALGFLSILFLAFIAYVINLSTMFNFEENLSSAMRFGSNMLALNVATSGYGIFGIGFGQFHFYYSPDFSPNFLLNSNEALMQMNNKINTRASTYNLPLRLWVETGIIGLIIAVVLFFKILRIFQSSKDLATQLGILFTLGSVGFLLTQDSYCLPSLALGLALVLSQPKNI
jgi:hypothetical protein